MQLVQWGIIAYTHTFLKSGAMEVYRERLWTATLSACSTAFTRAYDYLQEKEEKKGWNATTRR